MPFQTASSGTNTERVQSPNIYSHALCSVTSQMVDPGASSEKIREEVFEEFTSNIESSDIDREVADTILSTIRSSEPPNEFSEAMIEAVSEDNET